MNYLKSTIKEIRKALDDGKVTSVELLNQSLEIIKEKDKEINAFVSMH